MAIQYVNIPPLDIGNFTGPVRQMSGPVRSRNVILDSPHGVNNVPEFARWLYVGSTGNITYVQWDGTTQTLVGIAGGVWHPISSIQVNSSGTTATNLVWGS